MNTISGSPLGLRVARTLSRSHIRGAGVLTRLLGRLGRLDRIAEYHLGSIKFAVPLNRVAWDLVDLQTYEADLIQSFCDAIRPLQDVTLFDCGADIGTFSALVCSRVDSIGRIIACEPNEDTQDYLRANLANLAVRFDLVPQAVSNFTGGGKLASPVDNSTDHARFLVPGDGPLIVTTLDSLNIRGGDIALKLDIEGGELEALQGAAETICSARECVVAFEASPAVASRIGRDPVECMRFLESVRPFCFRVSETGQYASTASRLLSSDQREIWNIVSSTLTDQSSVPGNKL